MDANAERVVARLFAIETPMPKAKTEIRARGQSLVPATRAGDFAQALMDLGSAICAPKRPACANCPLAASCKAKSLGIQEQLPVKAPERVRPLKRGAAFVATDTQNAVLLVRRPEEGLLGGMMQPPLGPWTDDFPSPKEAMLQAPFRADWSKRPGVVRHGFTHFVLEIEVYVAELDARPKAEGKWVARADLSSVALPTAMRKILEHALDEGGPLFAQARSARRR
jgi:A/G-specific adenine glycosylase